MSYVAVVGGAGVLSGGIQALLGGHKQNQALKSLENLKTPTATASRPISDYYQEALNRYGVSPYSSRLYQMQQKNALGTTATALNSLQGRGAAVAGAGRLAGIQDNSLLNAGVQAEQQQNQRFGQLGSAASQKAADDKYVFGINQMLPYQKQSQLYSLKAAAGGQQLNAGLQGINSAIGNAGEIATAQQMYPKQPKIKPQNTGYNFGTVDLSGDAG